MRQFVPLPPFWAAFVARRRRHHTLSRIIFGAALLCGPFTAVTADAAHKPFADFVGELWSRPADAYVGQSGTAVSSRAAFEEMRRYLLKLYDGVPASHSFEIENQTFDCVPIGQQPAVRLGGVRVIAKPPPTPTNASPVADASPDTLPAAAAPGKTCEDGTVPMRRITLDEVALFKSLQHYFQKGSPMGAGDAAVPALAASAHAYAHEYWNINNYGGYSRINLWNPNPAVNPNAPYDQEFSLSQQWYVGGSGANLQTAEVGWMNDPRYYKTNKSVLFVYWTTDNYKKTGCHNICDNGGAFVQWNKSIPLGAPFSSYSQIGGAQYEVGLGYYFYGGNWWLAVGGQWIGYYPKSVYGTGQMSRYAQRIDFGGETVGINGAVTHSWPAMGSGDFAKSGYMNAAYQRQISYRDASNTGHQPSLGSVTILQSAPNCYTASAPKTGSEWGTYFFFGGTGGKPGAC